MLGGGTVDFPIAAVRASILTSDFAAREVAQSNPGTLILLLFLLFDGDLNLPLGEIRFV